MNMTGRSGLLNGNAQNVIIYGLGSIKKVGTKGLQPLIEPIFLQVGDTMMTYYICSFDSEADDQYCVYVLKPFDIPKLLKIFPNACKINANEAYYFGWTLPLKTHYWVGGFASTRSYVEIRKLGKQEIIREAINATYLTLLRAKKYKKYSDILELMPINLFL